MRIEIRAATLADAEGLKRVVERHPYAEYRCYRLFKHDFATDHLVRAVQSLLEKREPLACLAVAQERVVAFAGATRSDTESARFGIEMASIPFLLADGTGAERREVLDALLTALIAQARARGVRHLALKIDLADVAAVQAAEHSGFRFVDTLVTYVQVAARRPPVQPPINPAFELTTYRKGQFDQLTSAEIQPLVDFMQTSYHLTRFHMDRRLPVDISNQLSADWCRNIFSGKWADLVHVARREGRMVGFLGLQYFPELEARYGVKLAGRGLSGVLPEGRGAYGALVGWASANTPLDFGEYDTQIQNFPVINVWIRHGFAFLRGRYTLHRWLDN